MIVLDTNVVSEAMKTVPDVVVRAWLNAQAAETLYLSSVTLAELLFGIRALPVGKRKNMLDRALEGLLGLFEGRVLPFDAEAARQYADAFGRDPQFAQFYRSLEAYKASFNRKSDVMVLDPASTEFFKAFRGGSAANAPAAPAAPAAARKP